MNALCSSHLKTKFQKMNALAPLANIFCEAQRWPDSLYSDVLLYLGSRAKAFIVDWPKNSLLQEQSDPFY
jgi:hypothetical protein